MAEQKNQNSPSKASEESLTEQEIGVSSKRRRELLAGICELLNRNDDLAMQIDYFCADDEISFVGAVVAAMRATDEAGETEPQYPNTQKRYLIACSRIAEVHAIFDADTLESVAAHFPALGVGDYDYEDYIRDAKGTSTQFKTVDEEYILDLARRVTEG